MWKPKFKSATDPLHFWIAGGLVLISTIIVYVLLRVGLPLPEGASEEAVTIDALIYGHLVVIAFLFSLVLVVMGYALFMFRKPEGDESEGEHFEGNTNIEIAWTVLPLILVFIFAYWGINSLNTVLRTEENELVVDVKAIQWAWQFTYEGDVTNTELVLPLNRPAVMHMKTDNVMHGFWVREFRVKQDIIPLAEGKYTELRFTPTKLGEYTLGCTVLCGRNHWSMVAKVRVVPEAEFTAWINAEMAKVQPALASK